VEACTGRRESGAAIAFDTSSSIDIVAADGVAPEDMPINATLRDLGVERGDAPDEAAALGLRLPGAGQTDRSSSAR
jgi:hypothetical protein